MDKQMESWTNLLDINTFYQTMILLLKKKCKNLYTMSHERKKVLSALFGKNCFFFTYFES